MKIKGTALLSIIACLELLVSSVLAGDSTHARCGPFHAPQRPVQSSADAARDLRLISQMSEGGIRSLVPQRTAIAFCGCPNCRQDSQDFVLAMFDWDVGHPSRMRCKFCGHTYPSAQYPANRTQSSRDPLGQRITIRYYEDKEGNQYHFEEAVFFFQKNWLASQAYSLSVEYCVSRRSSAARRAAIIIDAFAQAYPRYCVIEQLPFKPPRYTSITRPPFPPNSGKWSRWILGEAPLRLIRAYDLICDSPELDTLSAELGRDVRDGILNDFFKPSVIAGTSSLLKEVHYLGNATGNLAESAVLVGRLTGDPALVHWGHNWVVDVLQRRFFRDGMWPESPSYHDQVLAGLDNIVPCLAGYSDPPGFTPTGGKQPLKDIQPSVSFPRLTEAKAARSVITYPNGKYCPVNDTWPSNGTGVTTRKAQTRILPAFGHIVLGAGTGHSQIEAHIHYSGDTVFHGHQDNLSLSLFAFGREMLADIGYTHTKLRAWATSTMSHNTVVIDRQEQAARDSDGDLLMFVPDLQGISIAEASGCRGYPGLASTYQRLTILIAIDAERPYLVDVFQVEGGREHDWLLHGSADHDMKAICNLHLAKERESLLRVGQRMVEPVNEDDTRLTPYGLMRNARTTQSSATKCILLTYADDPHLGVRVDLLDEVRTELTLCQVPSVRRAKRDDQQVHAYTMPQVMAHREGSAPLRSTFVAVIEPFSGRPHTHGIRRLPAESSSGRCVALQVKVGKREDTILLTLDSEAATAGVRANGLVLHGRIGIQSVRSASDARLFLVAGTQLENAKAKLTAPTAAYQGDILSAARVRDGARSNMLTTQSALPIGESLRGYWMILTLGDGHTEGYQIDRIEKKNDHFEIHLTTDHGLRILGDRTTEVYYPGREFRGKTSFRIDTHATSAPSSSPVTPSPEIPPRSQSG